MVVAYDFFAGRVERGPTGILGEAEGVEDGGYIAMRLSALYVRGTVAAICKGPVYDHLHVFGEIADLPSDTGVPIDPPRSSDACLAIEYAKLIKSELLLQLACHGNARCACTDNDDRVICVGILLIAIDPSYRFGDHLRK